MPVLPEPQWVFYPKVDLMFVFFINNMDVVSLSRSVRAITDAFLESDLSPDTSIRSSSQEYQKPAPLARDDIERLDGLFVDPESGYYLESLPADGRMRHNFIGQTIALEKTGECEYRTVGEVPVTARIADCAFGEQSDLLVDWGDWPAPRRFVRVGTVEANVVPADYVGDYYSTPLRSHWTVERGSDGLTLRIGAGVEASQRFELRALLPDIFTATSVTTEIYDLLALPTLAVRFERDAEGRVGRMHVSVEKVQGLEFERR